MAAIAFGAGLAGLGVNVIRIIQIAFGLTSYNSMFYIFVGIIMTGTAFLYYAEKQSRFASYWNDQIDQMNKNKVELKFCEQLTKITREGRPALKLLFYLAQLYGITFTMFPGVTNQCQLSFLKSKGAWFEILLVTVFNAFDTIGRYVAGKPKFQISESQIFVGSWMRVIHIGLFLYFAHGAVPVNIATDILKILNLAVFAASHGYLQTQCLVFAPSKSPEHGESVSYFINFMINSGIIVGGLIQSLFSMWK